MNSSTSSSTDSFAAGASELGELRCLVAEDHAFQRRSLVRILRGLGARYIEEAADGCVAVEFFRSDRDPLDLVLCDLDMPQMSGDQFVNALRLRNPDAARRVVIMTGSASPGRYPAGVRVIPKPVDPDTLAALLAGA